MGFLELTPESPLNLNKAVLSVFVRIPAATAAAVSTRDGFGTWTAFRVLHGTIPLFMFGAQQTGNFTGIGDYPMQPSCIGVRVGDGIYSVFGNGNLDIHLQTSDLSSQDDGSGGDVLNYICGDYFGNSDMGGAGDGAASHPDIEVDIWQHILLSWDLGTANSGEEESFSSNSELYCAVNRINKSGEDLPALWPESFGVSAGPNVMVSNSIAPCLGHPDNTSSVTISSIPYSPIWIPGPDTISTGDGPITATQLIDMAEFQLFTDVTLDTSDSANLDAFITEEGKPASPVLAAALLGKTPEIHFQTANDFITGNNRGTAGDFTPTGTIRVFTPGPSAD